MGGAEEDGAHPGPASRGAGLRHAPTPDGATYRRFPDGYEYPGFRLDVHVFEDVEIIDFAAPHGVFSVARRFDPEPRELITLPTHALITSVCTGSWIHGVIGLPDDVTATNREEPDGVEVGPKGTVPIDGLAMMPRACTIGTAADPGATGSPAVRTPLTGRPAVAVAYAVIHARQRSPVMRDQVCTGPSGAHCYVADTDRPLWESPASSRRRRSNRPGISQAPEPWRAR